MFEKLIPIMNRAEKIGLFAHTHPDGDAMGSSCALAIALRNMGKKTKYFMQSSPDAQAYSLLIRGDEAELEIADCDLLIALDSGDSLRLGKHREEFLAHPNSIAIDHHITHVPYAKSGAVVKDVSSTCELIYTLLREMDAEITLDIATDLYIGLATDTGNFKYSCVSGDTLRIAAELVDIGVPFADMAKVLFDVKPIEYYKLLSIAIDKLRVHCGGKAVSLYLSDADFRTAGIDESGANGIVNLASGIKGAEVGAYIRERGDEGEYKVSLRSNHYLDVADIAKHFGGGGHIHASGYSVCGKTADEIVDDLIEVLDTKWQS